MRRVAHVSFLHREEERKEIEEGIRQRYPTTVFAENPNNESISLKILKNNEIALLKTKKCLCLSHDALRQCFSSGIDPFEWTFRGFSRMNLFLKQKTFGFQSVQQQREKEIRKKIIQMHGDFSDYPDFLISEVKPKTKEEAQCSIVSPEWIDALYLSHHYIEPAAYIKGKFRPKSVGKAKGRKNENAMKTPREVVKEMGQNRTDDLIIRMQIKEKTQDIFCFFKNPQRNPICASKTKDETKAKLTPKKKKKGTTKKNDETSPFERPNTDTDLIDNFLKPKNRMKKEEKLDQINPTKLQENEKLNYEETTIKKKNLTFNSNENGLPKPDFSYVEFPHAEQQKEQELNFDNTDDEIEEPVDDIFEKITISDDEIEEIPTFAPEKIACSKYDTKKLINPSPVLELVSPEKASIYNLCANIMKCAKSNLSPCSKPAGMKPTFEETSHFTQSISPCCDPVDISYVHDGTLKVQLTFPSPGHDPLILQLMEA